MAKTKTKSSKHFLGGFLVSLTVLAAFHAAAASYTANYGGDHSSSYFALNDQPMYPRGDSAAGCGLLLEELEFDIDVESFNRRILATRKYISYGALRRNSVPCSKRGTSYYNCQTGPQANPYTRSCSQIARCRHS